MSDGLHSPCINMALLLLGSNIEPERHLAEAINELSRYGSIRAVSSVWESPPFGYLEQANFLNAAVWLDTALTVLELKETAISACENRLGRVRSANKNAPRTIDIDIVLYNSDILQVGAIRIPDPDLLERPFVAIPLAEIAPDYIHPETGESLSSIADRLSAGATDIRRRSDLQLSPCPASSTK